MPASEKHSKFDAVKAEAFAGQFLTALNYGSLCLMASIGHRTGLFDALSVLPPSTVEEIAKKAGLNEQYVRERNVFNAIPVQSLKDLHDDIVEEED